MGLDSKLYQLGSPELSLPNHHDEVETVTIHRGQKPTSTHHGCGHADHTHAEEHGSCDHIGQDDDSFLAEGRLMEALAALSKESVWRVKGFVRLESGYHILNWAFGRHELTPLSVTPERTGSVKLTMMGERGEVKRAARKLAAAIGADMA